MYVHKVILATQSFTGDPTCYWQLEVSLATPIVVGNSKYYWQLKIFLAAQREFISKWYKSGLPTPNTDRHLREANIFNDTHPMVRIPSIVEPVIQLWVLS